MHLATRISVVVTLIAVGIGTVWAEEDVYMCSGENAKIYCYGDILEAVSYQKLFPDDQKEFVDMPLIYSPNETVANYSRIFGKTPPQQVDAKQLRQFVDSHFRPAGHELLNCTTVPGWESNPKSLQAIKDPALKDWAFKLNAIWRDLCKKVDQDVNTNPDKYSLIYMNMPFIIPGGRFRESYYWDSYWVIKGLLASGANELAANIIYNFKDFINNANIGFIPNGGRVYYLKRSQPPLFIPMVYEYFQATGDTKFVLGLLDIMEKEFQYWVKNRQIAVKVGNENFTLYQYRTASNTPRPESFLADVQTAAQTKQDNRTLFRNLASAAESGQDFSTRWFADRKTRTTIETTNVVPVDLNSFLCWNMNILAFFFESVKDDLVQAKKYRDLLVEHRRAVHAVFFDESAGAWLDWNLREKQRNPTFYASLAAPLFTNCYNTLDLQLPQRMFNYFKKAKAFDFPSGVPMSVINGSHEQWDFPNGWGNINHLIIEGLRKSQNPAMQDAAFELATKWVRGNYHVFNKTGHMYEKYDVAGSVPQAGSGGEYNVQEGFGWTNGAILDLLVTYADRLTVSDDNGGTPLPSPSQAPGSDAVSPRALLPLSGLLAVLGVQFAFSLTIAPL